MSETDLSPAELARLESDARERAEEHRERVAEAERGAARQDRQDALMQADRLGGSPLGEMSRARAALSDAEDRVRDLESQLATARRKADSARGSVAFWAERMADVNDVVSRSAARDPLEAASMRAREAHLEYARNSRAAMRAAAAGERRPFAGRGDARRSNPALCGHCTKLGATAEGVIRDSSRPSRRAGCSRDGPGGQRLALRPRVHPFLVLGVPRGQGVTVRRQPVPAGDRAQYRRRDRERPVSGWWRCSA